MNTITISDLRSNLPSIVDKISENLERVVITVSGKPRAVVLSYEEVESLEETAEVLSVPRAYEMIKKGEQEAKKHQGVLLENLK